MDSRPLDPLTGLLLVGLIILSFLTIVIGAPAALLDIANRMGWLQ